MSERLSWVITDELNGRTVDLNDKEQIVKVLIDFMMLKTNKMFEWKGLPDTIPQEDMELLIQDVGYAVFLKHDDKYFAVYGTTGGIRNYNYRPTRIIVSNPYLLNKSQMLKVYYTKDDFVNPIIDLSNYDGECVVIQNDALYLGLRPLNSFYANQLANNVQTKNMVSVLSRATQLFVAQDQDTADSFEEFMKDLMAGKFTSIVSDDLIADAKTLPFSDKGHEQLTDLIEDQQYIKASWYNEVGLQANYNMKRESINSNESQLNKDAVLPLPDHMLEMRKLACKRINELFGLNISVEFSSAWNYTRKTVEQAIDAIDQTSNMKMTDSEETDQSIGQEEIEVDEKEIEDND